MVCYNFRLSYTDDYKITRMPAPDLKLLFIRQNVFLRTPSRRAGNFVGLQTPRSRHVRPRQRRGRWGGRRRRVPVVRWRERDARVRAVLANVQVPLESHASRRRRRWIRLTGSDGIDRRRRRLLRQHTGGRCAGGRCRRRRGPRGRRQFRHARRVGRSAVLNTSEGLSVPRLHQPAM